MAGAENPPLEMHWIATDRGVADVLAFLAESGPVRAVDIATRYGLTRSAAERLMKSLYTHGQVTYKSSGWAVRSKKEESV